MPAVVGTVVPKRNVLGVWVRNAAAVMLAIIACLGLYGFLFAVTYLWTSTVTIQELMDLWVFLPGLAVGGLALLALTRLWRRWQLAFGITLIGEGLSPVILALQNLNDSFFRSLTIAVLIAGLVGMAAGAGLIVWHQRTTRRVLLTRATRAGR